MAHLMAISLMCRSGVSIGFSTFTPKLTFQIEFQYQICWLSKSVEKHFHEWKFEYPIIKEIFVPLKSCNHFKNKIQFVLECEIKILIVHKIALQKFHWKIKTFKPQKDLFFTVKFFTISFCLLLVLANYCFYMKEKTSKCWKKNKREVVNLWIFWKLDAFGRVVFWRKVFVSTKPNKIIKQCYPRP